MREQLTIPTTRPRRARVVCRVCEGRRVYRYGAPCVFCRGSGVARFTCGACGEALPLCACFGEMRGEMRDA